MVLQVINKILGKIIVWTYLSAKTSLRRLKRDIMKQSTILIPVHKNSEGLTHIIHKFFINEDFYDFWSRSKPMEEEYDTVLSRVTL
jgi:hypothetical protein